MLQQSITNLVVIAVLFSSGCSEDFEATRAESTERRQTSDWPEYGGGQGQRFADVDQITAANVDQLQAAWIYRTGDQSDGDSAAIPSGSAFEVTPVLVEGALVFCTPFNRVIALDPLTGGELWRFDPEVDLRGDYGNQLVCRGVSQWIDPLPDLRSACRSRIFTNTNDGYLLALDSTLR